jgi:tetratricopeptide (TPR) repeat protein
MQLHVFNGRYDRARAVHRRAEERLASETDPNYRRHFEETIREIAARVNHDYDKALAKRFGVDIDFDKMFDEAGVMRETNQMAAANLCQRAIEMAQRGLYERAVQAFKQAIGLAPDYGFAWADLGTCLMEMERYPESFEALHRASELVDDFRTWFHLAKVTAKLGRSDEALRYFDEALRLDPSREQAWFRKGLTLLDELSRPGEALPCFEEAQRLGHPDAATMAEECRKQLGR